MKLFHLYNENEYQVLLDYTDTIFTKFGVDAIYYPTNYDEAVKLADESRKKGIKLFIRRARHVGSDKLPAVIQNFENYLLDKGVFIKDKSALSVMFPPIIFPLSFLLSLLYTMLVLTIS